MPPGIPDMRRSWLTFWIALLAVNAVPANASAQAAAAATGTPYALALAQVVDGGVLDAAGLFTADGAAAARDKIRRLRQEYHCAVLIDTVNRAGGRLVAGQQGARTADDFFHQWATECSRQFGVEGIHVLICKQPRHVAVIAWPEVFDTEFNARDRTGIERLFRHNLITAPDATLLNALDQMRTDLAKHREPGPPDVAFGPLGIFIAGAVGLWLVLSLVRLRWHKAEPFAVTGPVENLRLTAGLLASMFGNPASYWITDRLFPHETAGDSPGEPANWQAVGAEPPNAVEELADMEQTAEKRLMFNDWSAC